MTTLLRRHRLARVAGIAVSVFSVWLVFRLVDVRATAEQLARANPAPLAAALGVIAFQLLLRTIRWRALLAVTDPPGPLRIRALLPVLLVGYLGNAVLPARLGEPIRAYLVARQERIDGARAFGTVVLERVLDTASLAWLAFGAAVAASAASWLVQATGLVAAAGVVGVLVLVSGGVGLVTQWLESVGVRLRVQRAADLVRFIRLVASGADGAVQRGTVTLAIGVSLACWLLDATTFWLVGRSIGIDLAPAVALLIAAVTVLGTAIPSAPGYVGTFELAAAYTAGALGVPGSSALALAVLAHAVTVLPVAIAGAASVAASGSSLGAMSVGAEQMRGASATSPPS